MSGGLKTRVETQTNTVRKHSVNLTGDQLRELLEIPPNARVSVFVPGGGDWSNMALDIERGTTLDISWEEHS